MTKLSLTYAAEVAPMWSPQCTSARAVDMAGFGTANVFARRHAS